MIYVSPVEKIYSLKNNYRSNKLSERVPDNDYGFSSGFDKDLVDSIFEECNFDEKQIISTLKNAYNVSARGKVLEVLHGYINSYSELMTRLINTRKAINPTDLEMYNMLVNIYSTFNSL